jgi:general secretion pathway protein H
MRRILSSRLITEESGMTLLEVLLTLMIISLVTVSLGYRATTSERRALDDGAESLSSVLTAARAQALSTGSPVLVEIEPGAHRARVLPDGAQGHVDPQISLLVRSAAEISRPGQYRFAFFPDGTSSGGQIVVSATSASRSLSVSYLTGRVRDAE